MQVSVESKEGLERCMTVELPAERVNEEVEKRLKRLAKSAKLDGFRPGKVPLSVIRRRYTDQVNQEVFLELMQSSYFEALKQEDLDPAGEPKIERMEKAPEEGLGYTATFEVMPTVTLGDLDGQTVKRPVAEIGDEDVDKMIDSLRKQRTEWDEVEREAANDDRVTMNFKGYIDGELFEGGSADDVPLVLGSGRMIPGFEDGLIGAKAGENRTLELKFPEDYQSEELAGKDATFEVEVLKVHAPKLPEVDDEFAKIFSPEEATIEGLRKDIRNNLERELERRAQAQVKEQAMKALIEANELTVPQALIDQEAQELKKKALASLSQGGQANLDIDLPMDLFLEDAEKRVSLGLIIGEIVRENNIEINADRVREKVEQFAADYEDPSEVVNWYYNNKEQLAQVENLVLEDQVVDWILDKVKVEDESTTFAALTESDSK